MLYNMVRVISFIGVVSSLIMEYVFNWIPCELCLIQRLLIAVILAITIAYSGFPQIKNVGRAFLFFFAYQGMVVSYQHHMLLYESGGFCSSDSCLNVYWSFNDVIFLPTLSLVMFSCLCLLVTLDYFVAKKYGEEDKNV